MAEIEFTGIEEQSTQVIPGDFYVTDNGVVTFLVEYRDTYALFNALTGKLHADFLDSASMWDHLNNSAENYNHRPTSKIVIE